MPANPLPTPPWNNTSLKNGFPLLDTPLPCTTLLANTSKNDQRHTSLTAAVDGRDFRFAMVNQLLN